MGASEMRRIRQKVTTAGARLLFATVAMILALLPAIAFAAEPRQGDTVIVAPNETIDDDLYAFGGNVNMQGTVRGDLVAFAGTVIVSGTVTGDLLIGSGTVTVSGRIDGDIRAGGGTVTIDGPVGGDVLLGGGNLILGPNASVGRDLLIGGGTASVGAPVGRNLLAGIGSLVLDSSVGGNVQAEVDSLRLTDNAVVGGDLIYTSDEQADIAPGARIRGNVVYQEPERREAPQQPANTAVNWVRGLVGTFVLGLAFLLLLPGFSRRTMDTLRRSPWASLGIGFALLLLVPIAALVLLITGIFLGGWWLALMAMALYGIALALGFVTSGYFGGRWILERSGRPDAHPIWALLLGLMILTLLVLLPILGPLVGFAAVLFGLGALAIAAARARSQTSLSEAG